MTAADIKRMTEKAKKRQLRTLQNFQKNLPKTGGSRQEGPYPRKARLQEATKIVLMDPELVWVIHGVPDLSKHQVYAREIHVFGPEPDLQGILQGPPDFDAADWEPMQRQLIKANKVYTAANTVKRPNGLWYYINEDAAARLIVPSDHQLELAAWQHKALLHASKNKVIHALQKRFHWPTLRKDAADACRTCSSCAILNARRARAHRHYRAKVHSMPRST